MKSAEARAERAKKPKDRVGLEDLKQNTPNLIASMVDAALGRGRFSTLDPKDQMTATVRALEWVLGKPPTTKPGESAPADAPDPGEEPDSPLSFTDTPATQPEEDPTA